ncbi:Lactose transport system permease protein LacF [Petrocella atlantisensis]|uniref:Lactose transport system permease protein LacF n=1 Tax=Petrocella atlantisensis TaxID=2173034 RepID=A0A3P7PT75_9FIRM|nr:sugar ABC transporter permease [Petrocella atlantisensis]MCF8018119.1 sugar ABC transporter permease [Vallitaleaceae bacterium]PKM55112.1 MAG: lactose ABC transporter permease [Firmicutes bacterium HGW-Firmicutes-5]VDN46421.1 Lactose transport system permease protein LacF [Petrocella atlantisensis]
MKSTGKKKYINRKSQVIGWSFVAVAVILAAIFAIYPILNSMYLSTMSGKGVVYEFVGFGNIKRLFTDAVFKQALKNTMVYFIFQVPIMLTLALVIASLLNDKKLKFKGFFRTAIFLPCVTSLVAYSILFKSMFSVDGLVNQTLLFLNIIEAPIAWLRDAFYAKVTVIIAITWRWTGYNMIFYLAGLQNIDPAIYEAAEIDGASKTKQFFLITIPMLKPIILFTSIMSTIGTLQLFDEVVNLTGGGASTPTFNATMTLSQYIYDLSFKFVPNFGYAATVSYVIVFFIAILSIIQFRVAGDDHV